MVRMAVIAIMGLVLCPLAAADSRGTSLQGGRERQPRPEAEKPDQEKNPEETIEVTGTVVDRDGDPQARAQVSFEGPKRGGAWTGSDGAFEFEGPPGDYRVTVKIGGKSQTFQVKITKSGLQPSELEFTED